jgi:hypothetical protein
MGTRSLIAVVKGRQYRIAQYSQWDGYPSGQGVTALNFCRKLQNKNSREKFIAQLNRARWVTEEAVKAKLQEVGSTDGWMDDAQARRFYATFPFLGRDHGAQILDMVYKAPKRVKNAADEYEPLEILLRDSSDFAGDSLLCEYAYVIDLDKETFEIYKGFNKKPVPKRERFAKTSIDEKSGKQGYTQVKHVKTYSLKKNPSNENGVPGRSRSSGRG